MKKAIVFTSMLAMWGISSAQSYVGADLTLSKYGVSCAENNNCKSKRVGYDFRAGARFAPEHILDLGGVLIDTAEVGYTKFGRVEAKGSKSELYFNGVRTITRVVSTANSISANALYAAAVAHANIDQNLDLAAKLGLAYATTTSAYRSNGVTEGSKAESHFAPYVGVALEYALMSELRLVGGVDLTRYRADGRSGSLSAVRFGVNYAY
jgi:hypothetical protein